MFGARRRDPPQAPTVLHVIDRLDEAGSGAMLEALVAELAGQRLARSVVVSGAEFDESDALVARLRASAAELTTLRREGHRPRAAAAIAAVGRRHGVDVIHSHPGAIHPHARAAALLLRCPHVTSVDTPPDPGDRDWWPRSFAATLTALSASRVVAPCRQVADAYAEAHHLAARRLRVVASGAPAPVTPPPQERAALRARLTGGRRELPIVLCASPLQPARGVADAVLAAARLAEAGVAAQLVIAGDGPEREPLEALIAELELGQRVSLTGGAEAGRLLGVADVYCLPSRHDGLPPMLLEALAAGVPSVATRVGGVPGLIAHGRSGLLVRPGEPDELGRALARVLGHPAFAEHLTRGGLAVARSRSPRACARGYAQLYREVLAA